MSKSNWFSVASGLLGLGSSALNNAMSYGAASSLMNRQYDLNQRGLVDSPANARQGLEKAGYNPLLAVSNGVSMSPGTGLGQAANPDVNNSVTNAYRLFNLEKDKIKSDIEVNKANVVKTLEEAKAVGTQTPTSSFWKAINIAKPYVDNIRNFDYQNFDYKGNLLNLLRSRGITRTNLLNFINNYRGIYANNAKVLNGYVSNLPDNLEEILNISYPSIPANIIKQKRRK